MTTKQPSQRSAMTKERLLQIQDAACEFFRDMPKTAESFWDLCDEVRALEARRARIVEALKAEIAQQVNGNSYEVAYIAGLYFALKLMEEQ